jgi:GAF domain-containing protein
MDKPIFIPLELDDEQKYQLLIPQLKSLLDKNFNLISNLSNLTAVIKQVFSKVNWAGIYLFDGEKLYLGPFQGNVACSVIKLGTGVCGIAAKKFETIIVPDVSKYEGYISCDAEAKSEIVVPLYNSEKFFGVLDLDSNSYNAFNEIDKKYLENLREYLAKEIF